jgi:hypothetical protein
MSPPKICAFGVLGNPTQQVLCASYGQDLSDKHAQDCRTLMASPFYRSLFPHTRLAAKQSVGEFMTSRLGGRLAASVGGTVTGRGADWIIQDDIMNLKTRSQRHGEGSPTTGRRTPCSVDSTTKRKAS